MTSLKERDYFFDNARAILILLVVFGHMLQPYTSGDKYLSALYLVIYSFHMPTFLFISGYYAKCLTILFRKNFKTFDSTLYDIFAFFSIYYFLTGKSDELQLDPFNPVFALWFLITLFFFHVILVIVRRFNPYKVLSVSIIISIGAGFSDNDSYLSISRTIVFFPIFYLGYIFTKKHTAIFKNKKLIPVSIITFILFFIVYVIHPINADWLLGSSPYTSLENEGQSIFSPFKRLILYGIILIAMTAFLNLMSTKKKLYTYIGSRTLYVYLLHGLIIGIVRGFEWCPFDNPISLMTYLYLISISVIIVYVLSTNSVCKWTNPIINLQRPSQFKDS
ncbi:acyltransferase family protein [Staphylococcus aureus]